jgi:hypothetical protein
MSIGIQDYICTQYDISLLLLFYRNSAQFAANCFLLAGIHSIEVSVAHKANVYPAINIGYMIQREIFSFS